MAKQTINIGSGELSGDGETLRSAFNKTNQNFTEVYNSLTSISTASYAGISNTDISNWNTAYSWENHATQGYLTSTISTNLVPSTNSTYDLGSTSSQWRSLYVSTNTIYIGGTAVSIVDGNLTVGGNTVGGGGTTSTLVYGTYTVSINTSGNLSLDGISQRIDFADTVSTIYAVDPEVSGGIGGLNLVGNERLYATIQDSTGTWGFNWDFRSFGLNDYATNSKPTIKFPGDGYLMTDFTSGFPQNRPVTLASSHHLNLVAGDNQEPGEYGGYVKLSSGLGDAGYGNIIFDTGDYEFTFGSNGKLVLNPVGAFIDASVVGTMSLQAANTVTSAAWNFGADGNLSLPNSIIVKGVTSNSVAIGNDQTGETNQGSFSIAIGGSAAQSTQSAVSIAIGFRAGRYNQGPASVAIGHQAGAIDQSTSTIAIGDNAGSNVQGLNAVAVGANAGNDSQGRQTVAIGNLAGAINQGQRATAIGSLAGSLNQGEYALALGNFAGGSDQPANSIILNASGQALNGSAAGFFVDPVRISTSTNNILSYDPSTKEIKALSTTGNLTIPSIYVPYATSSTFRITTEVDMGPPSYFPLSFEVMGDRIKLPNGNGLIQSGPFTDPWSLDSLNKSFTFPNNSDIYYGDGTTLSTGTLQVRIDFGGEFSIFLHEPNKTWTFNNSGNIVFPDGTTQTTAYVSGSVGGYTPSTVGNWGTPTVTTISAALDELAQRTTTVESVAGVTGTNVTNVFMFNSNASFSMTQNVEYKIPFDTVTTGHDNGDFQTTSSQFIPQIAGWYLLETHLNFSGVWSGNVNLSVYKNNNQERLMGTSWIGNGGGIGGSTLVYSNGTTDIFEIRATQTSGGVQALEQGATKTWFQATWMKS